MPSQRPIAPTTPRLRLSRVQVFFAGLALFDVLIWTASALVH
jgi:hypothetical protein